MKRNLLCRMFGHRWVQDGTVQHPSDVNSASACPTTARRFRCSRCPRGRIELTPAGHQQMRWGDDPLKVMGLTTDQFRWYGTGEME